MDEKEKVPLHATRECSEARFFARRPPPFPSVGTHPGNRPRFPSPVADAKPIFLAIASAPTGEAPKPAPPGKKKAADEADAAAGPSGPVPATWEFLIKKNENNGWITSAAPGSALDVSQVMGGGFPMQENLEGFKYDFPTQVRVIVPASPNSARYRSMPY